MQVFQVNLTLGLLFYSAQFACLGIFDHMTVLFLKSFFYSRYIKMVWNLYIKRHDEFFFILIFITNLLAKRDLVRWVQRVMKTII